MTSPAPAPVAGGAGSGGTGGRHVSKKKGRKLAKEAAKPHAGLGAGAGGDGGVDSRVGAKLPAPERCEPRAVNTVVHSIGPLLIRAVLTTAPTALQAAVDGGDQPVRVGHAPSDRPLGPPDAGPTPPPPPPQMASCLRQPVGD